MVYGPEGGTTDLCAVHLAEWALDVAQGAYGPLQPARGAETAVTAADAAAGTEQQPPRKRRRGGQAQAAEDPESVEPQSAEVSGAEHHQ